MEPLLSIRLPFGRKAQIARDTYQAVIRAARIWPCDRRVASYAAGPHEGLTPEIVEVIRRNAIKRGELPARAYSRRLESVSHG